MTTVDRVRAVPVDVPLDAPFEIALGEQTVAENVVVTVETDAGVIGYGEAAPNPTVTGETQDAVVSTVETARKRIVGRSVRQYRSLVAETRAAFPGASTALNAIETALLDCYCRSVGIPMAEFFGGPVREVQTGLTIPLVDPVVARERAREALDAGFDTVKVKAGESLARDIERVSTVAAEIPETTLTVDANQGWTVSESQQFLEAMTERDVDVALLEQPVSRSDVRGLAALRSQVTVPIAADESVCSPADALEAIRLDAVDTINVKPAKSGLLGASDIVGIAEAADVGLMLGCMLEGPVGVHASAHLAAGTGSFGHIDLDSLALLNDDVVDDPGPVHHLSGPGHGRTADVGDRS